MNEFTLYTIFQSGMVLQREKPIVIWGNAPAKSQICVSLSASENSKSSDNGAVCSEVSAPAHADAIMCTYATAENTWQCTLPPQTAGENLILTATCAIISDNSDSTKTAFSETITLHNVSIGDVWLACGQSNMEFFLRYEETWDSIQNLEKNPKIHMYNVPQLAFDEHQKDTTGWGTWITEGDPGFDTFSAPGYSFARNLQPHIDVPIGIIGCNWGGTTASAWLDPAYLDTPKLRIYLDEYEAALKAYSPQDMERISLESWEFETSPKHGEDFMPLMYGRELAWQEQYMIEHADDPVIPMGPWSINRPGGLYRQMLEPLIPFAIKGALWYQGESDAGHADVYDKLMEALISCWRKNWQDDFPFLFVQLAPFGRWLQCDSTSYCETRKAQEKVSKTVPNTAMASIMDIGSYYDIHPKKKMEVGKRLALLARGHVYGESLLCDSPELADISIKHRENAASEIYLTFNNCQKLSITELSTAPLDVPLPDESSLAGSRSYSQLFSSGKIKGFRLFQNGQELAIDDIRLCDNQVILQANLFADTSCIVSLGWADYAIINLVNEAGLPIKPFMRCS